MNDRSPSEPLFDAAAGLRRLLALQEQRVEKARRVEAQSPALSKMRREQEALAAGLLKTLHKFEVRKGQMPSLPTPVGLGGGGASSLEERIHQMVTMEQAPASLDPEEPAPPRPSRARNPR